MNSQQISTSPPIQIDVLIIGGGIAGLWTHFLLSKSGYRSLLIDSHPLGTGQTIASQGMIHGGQRYTLNGLWNQQADTISKMPALWDEALKNYFQQTDILSHHQFLWSEGTGLLSKATSFFASKAMQTKTKSLAVHELPLELQKDSHFSKAQIFEMPEKVIAVQNFLHSLVKNSPPHTIFHGELKNWDSQLQQARIEMPKIHGENFIFTVNTKALIFSAGLSNEKAFEILGKNPANFTQRRPLTQVLIKGVPIPFYGHAITVDPRPRATITAHPHEGKWVWYLGGLIANYASEHTEKEALKNAYSEMNKLFPSLVWKNFEWATHSVDRAEPKVNVGFMPEGPEISTFIENKIMIGWPTKMTFAPLFAEKIMQEFETHFHQSRIQPNQEEFREKFYKELKQNNFSSPQVAPYPWEDPSKKWVNTASFL